MPVTKPRGISVPLFSGALLITVTFAALFIANKGFVAAFVMLKVIVPILTHWLLVMTGQLKVGISSCIVMLSVPTVDASTVCSRQALGNPDGVQGLAGEKFWD